MQRYGRLDAVVCAHGGSGRRFGDGPVDECTEEGWDATLEMNLKSVYLVCRAAVPALRAAGGGAIVTVASVLGLVGDRDFATHAYAASKGGLIALTRAMAVTYAPDGIRCNVVCPGLIATPMSARAQGDPAIRERLGRAAAADRRPRTPRGRRRGRAVPRDRAVRDRQRADRRRRLDRPVSLHLGLDLGGTNIKAAVVDSSLRRARHRHVPDRRRRRRGRRARAGRLARPGGRLALRRAGVGGARAARPLRRGRPARARCCRTCSATGRAARSPARSARRWACRSRSSNDVRALTLAELRLGAGRGAADLVCIALGTGVGGGVVIGGRLHLGLGHAGEIGHTTVDPDGPLCGCGNRGCLDRMASAESIAAAAGRAERGRGRRGGAGRRPRSRWPPSRVPASTWAGCWRARSCCFGPSAWWSAAAWRTPDELLLDPLRAELRRRACVAPEIPVVPAELGPVAGAVGAALWGAEVSRAA